MSVHQGITIAQLQVMVPDMAPNYIVLVGLDGVL